MFEYKKLSQDGNARIWRFATEHGDIETPVFMPVGTKWTVKWITHSELDDMWAQIILNNTYHLYLKPWDEVVKQFWWAHKFQSYHKPILTDSGWFQVFSLGKWHINPALSWEESGKNGIPLVKITEQWVHFRSYHDGSRHFFDAERVMDIQSNIWADIIMAFDECAPGDSSKSYARAAMDRTHRWAERCVAQWKKNNALRAKNGQYLQALFPICQWVMYDDLREESAKFISKLDCPWLAIGWLSVWESKEDMYRTLDVVNKHLDSNKPRYLMWVGTPQDLVEGIYRGVDMFDCVLPTRIGRHGRAFSSHWDINLKNAKHKLSNKAIDDECDCKACANYSRGYLHHLIKEKEMQWMSLVSYHNLRFLLKLCEDAKAAIRAGTYKQFREDFYKKQET